MDSFIELAKEPAQYRTGPQGKSSALSVTCSESGVLRGGIRDTSTPILILGGKENSLSITRHLGGLGVSVRVSGPANCWGIYSRYCQESFLVRPGTSAAQFWHNLLLASDRRLDGHVIFACSDEAIEFIADNYHKLAQRYVVGDAVPALQKAFLDKRRTLELAREAGIDAPAFWSVKSVSELDDIADKIRFPVMVKPIHSHKFIRIFGVKLFVIESSAEELKDKITLAQDHGLEVMIVEMIPGADRLLSSYYSYIDADGTSLFQFTKRILRRFPTNSGGACYHVTEWCEETARLGQQLFARVGLRGFGNVEFKRDPRDGKLKIIEVNSRFTAAQELLLRSGAAVDAIVYCHVTRQPGPHFVHYRQQMRYWYPLRDFLAFLELRKRGELSFLQWARSIVPYHQVLPLWNIRDPLPCLGAAWAVVQVLVCGRR
jgi:predicted ATP-grasp superfamily ATP-dependent carboligase